MPSPIGHALGGLIAGLALAKGGTVPSQHRRICDGAAGGIAPKTGESPPFRRGTVPRRDLTICAIAACLPDVDFLWGRHNMETHSVGFAVLVGIAVFAVGPRLRRLLDVRSRDVDRETGLGAAAKGRGRLAMACTVAVLTHVLFDWLGSDATPPFGVMALWPLTDRFFFADAYVFDAITRRYWLPGFVQHNTLAIVRELVTLGPVAGALWVWRARTLSR